MGRKAGVTQSQERATLSIALRDVSDVVLSLPKIGKFRIAEIPSRLSQQFYDALLQRCPEDLRTSLQNDDALHLDDVESWWYVLNEMLAAGVTLPIAGDVPEVPEYEPAEEPCDTGPVSVCINGVEMNAYQQMRSCGVKICKKCAGGKKGHGPYWIGYGRVEGKRVRKYIGRKLPE